MKDTRLLKIFNETKDVLCRYDYYIHTAKRILHLLVRYIMKLNVKFGEYHTLDMLSNTEQLLQKCRDKRDEALVKDFISLWKKPEQKN